MKYVSKLNEDELMDLIYLFTGGSLIRMISLTRDEDRVNVTVEIETKKGRVEELFSLYDYKGVSWDYDYGNDEDILIDYREKMLNWFGNNYAIDFLLGY